MATTNDTDPQREQPFHDDTSRTEPGAPPLTATAAADPSADAAALLAGLAPSPQPTPEVPETEGHVAASYAAAPHRPPRPNDKTIENPAVFINATVPLPQPPSSGRQKLGPPAAPVVSMKGDPTVLGGARLFEHLANQTDPGERSRNQLKIYLASIAGIVVAALIVIVVLAVAQRSSNTNAAPSASAASAPLPPLPIPSPVVTSTTAPSATTSATPSPTTPPVVTTKPHVRPHGTSPAARPSGTFAEPDRRL